MIYTGYLFSMGSVFAWGTALVFLKLPWVKRHANPVAAMILFYSFGYFFASMVAWGIMAATSNPDTISILGVLGGAIWGAGKMLTILSVTGELGIASGQAVQCVVNVATSFLAGVATGEDVFWLQIMGVVILAAGLCILVLPRIAAQETVQEGDLEETLDSTEIAKDRKWQGLEEQAEEAQPVGVEGTWPALESRMAGVGFAVASGLCMGLQAVPFKYDTGVTSWEYSVGQGFGQFAVVTVLCGGTLIKTRPDVVVVPGLAAGLAGGGLLYVAAACNTAAVQYIGLVGSCMGQMNMVVAGLWGIFLFNEISTTRGIAIFFVGVVVALGGAILMQIKHL